MITDPDEAQRVMRRMAQIEYAKLAKEIDDAGGQVPDWDSFSVGFQLGCVRMIEARKREENRETVRMSKGLLRRMVDDAEAPGECRFCGEHDHFGSLVHAADCPVTAAQRVLDSAEQEAT